MFSFTVGNFGNLVQLFISLTRKWRASVRTQEIRAFVPKLHDLSPATYIVEGENQLP